MPHLHIPSTDGSGSPRAVYFRRTLHRGYRWHCVELACGDVLILERPADLPRARLAGDAAAGFRLRLYSALGRFRGLPRFDDMRRDAADRVCAAEAARAREAAS